MKVLHLSLSDLAGGAARAAFLVHRSVQNAGVDSHMLVLNKRSADPTVLQWEPEGWPLKRMWTRIRQRAIKSSARRYRETQPIGVDAFTDSRLGMDKEALSKMRGYDVIHLHETATMLDWTLMGVPQLAQTPVVFTLHDIYPFSGGCHFAGGCIRFEDKCGRCPQLGSPSENDLSRDNWERKHAALKKRTAATCVVGPSEWIAGEARRSSLFARFPVKNIRYGIDTNVFLPRHQESIRRLLGIDLDAAVIMFVADSISSPRKGFAYLLEALKELQVPRKFVLLSVGAGTSRVKGDFTHLHLGSVNNDLFLSMVYSAANFFVVPSLEDNSPLTAHEAAACGLALIAFDVGGLPELVENGRTGFIVPAKDSRALRGKILELIGNPTRCSEMGAGSRKRIESLHTLELQGRNYQSLYSQLCSGSGPSL